MNGHNFQKYRWKPGDGKTDGLYVCAKCGARTWVQEITGRRSHLIAYTINFNTYSADVEELSCNELQVMKVMKE
jgi:glutamate formiminotransferase